MKVSLRTIVFFMVIVMGASVVQLAAKCEAEKNAMDAAWNQYVTASKAWEASLGRLGDALGKKAAADKTFDAAVKKVQTCTADYQFAEKEWRDCLDSGEHPDCGAAERLMDRAKEKLDKAVDVQLSAFADCTIAETDLANARAATNGLFQAMEQARDNYDQAREAYWQCLRGKRAA